MKLMKYMLMALAAPLMLSCSDDKFTDTIFPDVSDEANPNTYTYDFDNWLNKNFRDEYNVSVKYLMEDIESDRNYNLVPAQYDKAVDLALLTKYLWYDSYKDLCGAQFLKQYGPKMLHFIGSPAYNPNNGSETVGLSEGGVKVTLFKVNEMDVNDIESLNDNYFRTMHHEFAHILHQTKSYPTEYNTLSNGRYDNSSWTSRKPGPVASEGFITNYGSSQVREDFAEIIANYLTRSDEQWELMLWMSKKGWSTGEEKKDHVVQSKTAPYYCCYYLPDEEDPDNKKYFLRSMDGYKGIRGIGLVGEDDSDKFTQYFTTVAEVEEYLAKMEEKHPIYWVEDNDGVVGDEMIEKKLNIARNWFKSEWNINLDDLRAVVREHQEKAAEMLVELRNEVYGNK